MTIRRLRRPRRRSSRLNAGRERRRRLTAGAGRTSDVTARLTIGVPLTSFMSWPIVPFFR
jgi:hypothetical protein